MENNSLKQKKLEESSRIESKTLYKGKFFTLIQDLVYSNNEPPHQWDLIKHKGAVAIIPIAANGDVLLIRQWRRAIQRIIYEIPAGLFNHEETPEECAIRETQEEVGFKPQTLIPLQGIFAAPGYCDEYIHLFIGKDLLPSSLPQDPHEAIDLNPLPLSQCLHLIDSGEIRDAKTICALLRYERWLKRQS